MNAKPMMKSLVIALGALLCGTAAAWNEAGGEKDEAMHLEPDRERGIAVFEVCSACHLLEGWGLEDGTFPQLAGQHRNVLIKQLADIRAKNRDNPTMYPFALDEQIMSVAGYHEGEINPAQLVADVTAYIAKLPMNPENGKGPWNELFPEFAEGKKLYKDNCVRCHGENGEGNNEKFFPKIHGQHYAYMLRQFEWIRDGKRRNANPDMVDQIKNFSDKDMQMVINYVSRIPVPKEDLAPSKDWQNPDYD
jgi:cytochrome c553